MKKWKLILLIVLIAGLGAGIYGWNEYHREHTTTSGIKAVAAKDAKDLVKEFEADENSANQKYNDKAVSVNGTIAKIEKNDSTQTVVLTGESPMAGVICQFELSGKSQLENLKTGQAVKIKGICTGMLMDVILVRCVLDGDND